MPLNNMKKLLDDWYTVMNLVAFRLPRWLWAFKDIDESNAKGALMSTWGECEPEKADLDIGGLLVADATDDPTEPDVSGLSTAVVQAIMRDLQKGLEAFYLEGGMRILKWQSTNFVESDVGNGILTQYILLDQGKERQHIDLRFGVKGRKVVVIAYYDVLQCESLGLPICQILQRAVIVGDPLLTLGTLFAGKFLVPGLYSGGNGETMQAAVMINTKKRHIGVSAEYAYIECFHGPRDTDWSMLRQELMSDRNGRSYDVLRIKLRDGSLRTYFFDISEFF